MHAMWPNREPMIAQLERGLVTLVDALNDLPPATLEQPSSNPGWTTRDTLVHLVASEASMLEVAENIASGRPNGDPATHDQAAVNQAAIQRRAHLTLSDLVEELKANRQRAIRFARESTEAALTRPGLTPAGRQRSAGDMLERIVAHQEAHLAEVLQAHP